MGNNYNFGEALEMLKNGSKVARYGWNGIDMFLLVAGGYSMQPEGLRPEGPITAEFLASKGAVEMNINRHIDMWTNENTYATGWTPSQADMFAEDWFVVE